MQTALFTNGDAVEGNTGGDRIDRGRILGKVLLTATSSPVSYRRGASQ